MQKKTPIFKKEPHKWCPCCFKKKKIPQLRKYDSRTWIYWQLDDLKETKEEKDGDYKGTEELGREQFNRLKQDKSTVETRRTKL